LRRKPRPCGGSRAPRAAPGPRGAAAATPHARRGQSIGAVASVQVSLADPLADRGLGQVQLSGDLAHRLAGAADQLDDLSLVLRRKEPAWSWHRTPISRAGPSSWVSTKPGQLQLRSCGACVKSAQQRTTRTCPTIAAGVRHLFGCHRFSPWLLPQPPATHETAPSIWTCSNHAAPQATSALISPPLAEDCLIRLCLITLGSTLDPVLLRTAMQPEVPVACGRGCRTMAPTLVR
jgi:hypothetical protein